MVIYSRLQQRPLIFERLNDEIKINHEKIKKYSDTEKEFWNFFVNSVKSDKLILTHASQLEINKEFSSFDHIRSILNWFKNSLTIVYPNSRSVGIHFELLKNEDLRLMFSKFLSYFDTNINSLELHSVDPSRVKFPEDILTESIHVLLEEDGEKTTAILSEQSLGSIGVFTKKWR